MARLEGREALLQHSVSSIRPLRNRPALRGEPLATPLTVAGATLKFPPLASVEELLTVAATNNFELRMREVELAQQGFKVDLARNERWPAIKVTPFIHQEKAGDI